MLKRRLGINEPTVGLGATTLYEEGEGADDRLKVNLKKRLKVSRCALFMSLLFVVTCRLFFPIVMIRFIRDDPIHSFVAWLMRMRAPVRFYFFLA